MTLVLLLNKDPLPMKRLYLVVVDGFVSAVHAIVVVPNDRRPTKRIMIFIFIIAVVAVITKERQLIP